MASRRHSRCVQVAVDAITSDELGLFSEKDNEGNIPLVLIPDERSRCSLFMCVPTGVSCLLQCFGKDMGEAEPGLALKPAWWRIAYIVSKQSNTYDAPVQRCPTSDNVQVSVDVVVVFNIEDASKFVYQLGVANFDEFLSATVDEAIRSLVRGQDHTQVYGLRGERASDMLNALNEKFEFAGVHFSDAKITSVWYPRELADKLEATTKIAKSMDKLQRQHEFEILQVTQESDMEIEQIKRKAEQVLTIQMGQKKKAQIDFEQKSISVEQMASVAKIRATMNAEARTLDAQTKLNRTKQNLETQRVLAEANAHDEASAVRVQGELKAQARLQEGAQREKEMTCEAQATKFKAAAEEAASNGEAGKRQHSIDLREKEILASFAKSGKFNLVGTAADGLLRSLFSGSLPARTDCN